MAITREEKNATWTEQDAANFVEACKQILKLSSMANKHFTGRERNMLRDMTAKMEDLADKFEDEPEHEAIKFVEHDPQGGLRPDMGVDGTINTPGFNRSRMWTGETLHAHGYDME